MRILVTGKNGQLGKSIHKVVTKSKQVHEFIFVGREELDLSKKESITSFFDNNNFDIIINCAAYTAVDKAEVEIELADQVNHIAVKQLAKIAVKQKTKLIHISTDYIFDGESNKPYRETDVTNPLNTYGKTKLAGEQAVQTIMQTDAIIIRTSWVYSEYGNNFVDAMLRLGKERGELSIVCDQIGSPTYATDLARAVLNIVKSKIFIKKDQTTQIYHFSNEGDCSWYEFAKEVFKIAKIECKVKPITTDQYMTPAVRPRNTLMNKVKMVETFDIDVSYWKESLRACITLSKKKLWKK